MPTTCCTSVVRHFKVGVDIVQQGLCLPFCTAPLAANIFCVVRKCALSRYQLLNQATLSLQQGKPLLHAGSRPARGVNPMLLRSFERAHAIFSTNASHNDKTCFILRKLVHLVIHDSGQVSFEYLSLSWYPSQTGLTGENPLRQPTLSLSTSGFGPVGCQRRTLSLFAGQGRRLGSRTGSTFFLFFFITLKPRME